MKKVVMILFVLLVFASCVSVDDVAVYLVTYDKNEAETGIVPVDNNKYEEGETVIVIGNIDPLAKVGYDFSGWNSVADGSGTSYAAGSTFLMGDADLTLYAQWTANGYSIIFDANDIDAIGTMANQVIASDDSANLKDCTFSKPGGAFVGWALTSAGEVDYTNQAIYNMTNTGSFTLYAKWVYDDTYNLKLREVGPAGGIVFYVNTNVAEANANGWTYMAASPKLGITNWGYHGTAFYSDQGIGAGKNSTLELLASGAYNAAIMCDAHSANIGGKVYSNWYLPSLDELVKMHTNLISETDENGSNYTAVSGYANEVYSSSSDLVEFWYSEPGAEPGDPDIEFYNYLYFNVDFNSGHVGSNMQYNPSSIVAVRYF